jgi:hypothetical protein
MRLEGRNALYLFIDGFNNSDYAVQRYSERGGKMTWPHLRYYAEICLEGLKKITKNSVRRTDLRIKI